MPTENGDNRHRDEELGDSKHGDGELGDRGENRMKYIKM
jgi:hypothetical protein